MKKVAKRRLMEQLARVSLPCLQLIKDCTDEIVAMRAPEFEARRSVEAAAKSRGVNLKEELIGSVDIIVTEAEKRRSSVTTTKSVRYFLVAGESVTLVARKSKADALIKAGANVVPYDGLPDHLKEKVDNL